MQQALLKSPDEQSFEWMLDNIFWLESLSKIPAETAPDQQGLFS